MGAARAGRHSVARKIKQRGGAQGASNDAEAGVWSDRGGILESVPPGVDLSKVGATDGVPVLLGVLDGWDTKVLGAAADGPSSLGNPDRLAGSGILGLLKRSVEQASTALDGVRHGALEVGVGIHADPVTSLRDSTVRRVGPGSPGVNVTDGSVAQRGAFDGITDQANVSDDVRGLRTVARLGSDTHGRAAVEILTANRDTDDELCEVGSVLLDGGLEGSDFGLEGTLTAGGPETEQQRGVFRNGGGNGRCGLVGGASTLLEDS